MINLIILWNILGEWGYCDLSHCPIVMHDSEAEKVNSVTQEDPSDETEKPKQTSSASSSPPSDPPASVLTLNHLAGHLIHIDNKTKVDNTTAVQQVKLEN